MAWAEAYLHDTKWHLDPASRLATIDMGLKLGCSAPFRGGGAGPLSNTKLPAQRPTSLPSGILIHSAIWPQPITAKNWGAGSPSNTMWPGARPTCMPSFISTRHTIWPQYTNVTDRQDRTQTDRQQSDSTEQTVLQTVAKTQQFSSTVLLTLSLYTTVSVY